MIPSRMGRSLHSPDLDAGCRLNRQAQNASSRSFRRYLTRENVHFVVLPFDHRTGGLPRVA